MKTLKIGIVGYDRMKARTIAIGRGERKPARGEPKVWFTSVESFAKVLSQRNRELLTLAARVEPDSLTELAELSGRNKSNLSRTLKTMSRYGLVELKAGDARHPRCRAFSLTRYGSTFRSPRHVSGWRDLVRGRRYVEPGRGRLGFSEVDQCVISARNACSSEAEPHRDCGRSDGKRRERA